MRRIDCVVIGAGQAGLGVSRELVERGIEHVVLEQGRIGETWRSQRWDAFALNSPAWMNRLPGDAAPARPDDFQSAPEFAIALERYAFRHRLPVHESVTVRSLDVGFGGDSLSVATDAGVLQARSVVVASGGARVPRVPAMGASLSASILQLHAAGYRSADELPAGSVLVVGGGQSGVQIAEDLLHAGRRVFLATSTVGRLPRRYRGRDAFAWLVDDGFFDERPTVATAPTNPQISGAAGGHTLSYQHLERLGALLLGGMAGMSGPRVLCGPTSRATSSSRMPPQRRSDRASTRTSPARGSTRPSPNRTPPTSHTPGARSRGRPSSSTFRAPGSPPSSGPSASMLTRDSCGRRLLTTAARSPSATARRRCPASSWSASRGCAAGGRGRSTASPPTPRTSPTSSPGGWQPDNAAPPDRTEYAFGARLEERVRGIGHLPRAYSRSSGRGVIRLQVIIQE